MTHEHEHREDLDIETGNNEDNNDADQTSDTATCELGELATYAAALADRVEPTQTKDVVGAAGAAANSGNSNGPDGRQKTDSSRPAPIILVAAALVFAVVAGAVIFNLQSRSDHEVIAAASDIEDDSAATAHSTTPPPDDDQSDQPSTGGAIALTTPVTVTVRGFLVQDPRGHNEICSFDAWIGVPCAGVQIIGADDPAQIEALTTTGASPLGITTAHGTLGVEGLWIHTIEQTQHPDYAGASTSDQNCVTVECSRDVDSISAAVADAVNAATGKHPELSITSIDIGYTPDSEETQAAEATVVIGVAKINTELREELIAAVMSATEHLGSTSVTIRPWIQVHGDAIVSDIPNFYPSSGPLLTAHGPNFGSMQALLVATLDFDSATGCPFAVPSAGQTIGSADDQRVHIMWPFGYTASLEDQTILNFDSEVVARHGDQLELGGGYVPYRADETNQRDDSGSYVSACGIPKDVFLTGGLPARAE